MYKLYKLFEDVLKCPNQPSVVRRMGYFFDASFKTSFEVAKEMERGRPKDLAFIIFLLIFTFLFTQWLKK